MHKKIKFQKTFYFSPEYPEGINQLPEIIYPRPSLTA